jgi:hypothetical protein
MMAGAISYILNSKKPAKAARELRNNPPFTYTGGLAGFA